jgi:hypothetical protein
MFYEWQGEKVVNKALRVKRELEKTYLVPGMEVIARKAGPPGLENIIGMGIGEKMASNLPTGELAIKVYVIEKLPHAMVLKHALVPDEFDGFKTDVEEVGEIRALRNTRCYRPAPGGVSCGHVKVTAGTLGCLIKIDNTIFILSNNHVLANANDAHAGDFILQPGACDGGRHDDRTHPGKTCRSTDRCIGILKEFIPIKFSGKPNKIDAAIARPLAKNLVSPEIIKIGKVQGTAPAKRKMFVKKSGRTTQLTHGIITDTNGSFWINYDARQALFTDQIVVRSINSKPFSEGGDSGALVLDDNSRALGLLFAGSPAVTLVNKIDNVLAAFKAATAFDTATVTTN